MTHSDVHDANAVNPDRGENMADVDGVEVLVRLTLTPIHFVLTTSNSPSLHA